MAPDLKVEEMEEDIAVITTTITITQINRIEQ
jgi:hypothetical protein